MLAKKKTFFYKFFPTKDEALSNPIHYQTRRALVEIRDDYPPPVNPINPWRVVKRLTLGEVATGKVIVSENDTMEHVFRYWGMEMCNRVVLGNKVCVLVYDVTDESHPVTHGPGDENTAFEKGLDDCYVLRLNMSVVRNWAVRPGANIGLYWNYNINAFYLKVFY